VADPSDTVTVTVFAPSRAWVAEMVADEFPPDEVTVIKEVSLLKLHE
jgi:hypothetical protein